MEDKTQINIVETALKVFRILIGFLLVLIYAITGVDGVILIFAAFLFGIPLEYVISIKRKNRGVG